MGLIVAGFLAGMVVTYLHCREQQKRLERELAEAGDYAYRLLESPSFFQRELATAMFVADSPLYGDFGRIAEDETE